MVEQTKSRTEYSARNAAISTAAKILSLLMGYVARIVFTHTLSEVYVGVNGLFVDILNVLSLTELGFGTAMTYALYKPIAEDDVEKQKSYMKLYAKIYHCVGFIVLLLGLCVLPFLKVIVKGYQDVPKIGIIYLMYLAGSVTSYFFVYKKTLIDAHQMKYIGVVYQNGIYVVQTIVQIALLIFTKNFFLYLIINILSTLVINLLVSRKADKMYPYLLDKNVEPLKEGEKKKLFTDVKDLFVLKIGNIAVNNTDNILLSSFVGIVAAGLYSNYLLITEAVKGIIIQIFNAISASVGNLGATGDDRHIKKIFDATFFINNWIYGLAAIILYEAVDPFVALSFGKQYVFEGYVTLIICINFYMTGMRHSMEIFKDALGLFKYDKYRAIAAALVNLIVSVVLGIKFGTFGIFLGTLISTITISLWMEPWILIKKRLNMPLGNHFLKYFLYASATFICAVLSTLCCRKITTENLLLNCIFRGLVCLIIVDAGYFICFFKTKEFRFVYLKGRALVEGKLKGKKTE